MPVFSTASWTTSIKEPAVMSNCKRPGQDEAAVVVQDGDQVVVAPAGYLEVGAVAGPHLVGARGLAVVFLLGSEAQHFRWLHEAVALEQAVAAGLRYGESAGIGDAQRQLSWTQLG